MQRLPVETVRVLHVDDDDAFAEQSAESLERADPRIEVDAVSSVAAAFDRLESTRYDCIISEYEVGDADGLAFLETVRADDPDLPFVLLTGNGDETVASEAISAGVTDYVRKADCAEGRRRLADRIGEAVDGWQAKRDYRQLCETVPVGVAVHDPSDGTLTDVNARYAELFGYEREELLDRGLAAVVPDETPYTLEDARRRVRTVADSGPRTFEWPGVTRDGDRIWTEVHLTPVHLHGRDRVLAVVRDVTERREREEALVRSRELLGHTERLARTGGWELDVETDAICWTDGTYAIHDLPPDGDFEPTLERSLEFYHPADRETVADAIRRCRRDGDRFEVELRLRSAADRLRWVRVAGEAALADGDPVAVRGAIRDITERKRRERELGSYEAVIEAIDDAVYVTGRDGEIRYVNESYAEMKGVDRDRLEDTPIDRWVDDEVVDRIRSVADEIERGERDAAKLEYEFRTTDGERIPAELRFTDLEFPDGDGGRVGVVRDVSERTERERALERRNERLDEFASIVSHDLRNPLNVLDGSLELAEETGDPAEFDRCRRAIERMDELVDDLLTLARNSDADPDLDPTSLATVAKGCWRIVDTAGATLETPADGVVLAEEGRLRRLFENLFRNAVEHGGESVSIVVGDLDDGFYVEDDGTGIPADERDRVFESGYSTGAERTGLGLSIVAEIVDAHGWTVDVTDGVDGGTRFEITGVEAASPAVDPELR
jgi:PAS domain S-box-containing protein